MLLGCFLHCVIAGWRGQTVLSVAVTNMFSCCDCAQHHCPGDGWVVPQLIEWAEFSFSPSLGFCQTHGSVTYILKILHFQFGCSWLCCVSWRSQPLLKLDPDSEVRFLQHSSNSSRVRVLDGSSSTQCRAAEGSMSSPLPTCLSLGNGYKTFSAALMALVVFSWTPIYSNVKSSQLLPAFWLAASGQPFRKLQKHLGGWCLSLLIESSLN